MATVFTYGATVCTFLRGPSIDGYDIIRRWESPMIRAGGGKVFVYNKDITRDIITLTWNAIDPTDLTNLLAFFAEINWSGNLFDFESPDGEFYSAQYWGPADLRWTPEVLIERDLTIELLVSGAHITDESGSRITDESGDHIISG